MRTSIFSSNQLFIVGFFLLPAIIICQNPNLNYNKFKQLKEEMSTPNVYRTASGAPGHQYYQNEADYVMEIKLDDENQKITGTEVITYHNNSPDKLEYLWLQLDQNKRALNSDSYKIQTSSFNSIDAKSLKNASNYLNTQGDYNASLDIDDKVDTIRYLDTRSIQNLNPKFDGGFNITSVTN